MKTLDEYAEVDQFAMFFGPNWDVTWARDDGQSTTPIDVMDGFFEVSPRTHWEKVKAALEELLAQPFDDETLNKWMKSHSNGVQGMSARELLTFGRGNRKTSRTDALRNDSPRRSVAIHARVAWAVLGAVAE